MDLASPRSILRGPLPIISWTIFKAVGGVGLCGLWNANLILRGLFNVIGWTFVTDGGGLD